MIKMIKKVISRLAPHTNKDIKKVYCIVTTCDGITEIESIHLTAKGAYKAKARLKRLYKRLKLYDIDNRPYPIGDWTKNLIWTECHEVKS